MPAAATAGGLAGASWWMTTFAGKGGLILWPLFGATNQLLAGLAFLVVSFFLWRRNIPVWFIVIPMIFMLIMPAWAMLSDLAEVARRGKSELGRDRGRHLDAAAGSLDAGRSDDPVAAGQRCRRIGGAVKGCRSCRWLTAQWESAVGLSTAARNPAK